MTKRAIIGCFFILLCNLLVKAQYPPPAGQAGTTAIASDSAVFVGWATVGINLVRGYIDISDTNLTYFGSNRATFGSILYVNGPSDEYVLSLGDGGTVTLTFERPIGNGTGPDFAVFENSFSNSFLELAFVDVSSNGTRFVRLPSVSLCQDTVQIGTFDTTDARLIHNLAGKYQGRYGVPFDLDDLKDSLDINLNSITHVRVTDVVGCIQSPFASFDSQGNKINDPWPTPFDTGGFDLESVGVIHYGTTGITNPDSQGINIFPNPVDDKVNLNVRSMQSIRVTISDLSGRIIMSHTFSGECTLDMSGIRPGIYFASFEMPDGQTSTRKIVRR